MGRKVGRKEERAKETKEGSEEKDENQKIAGRKEGMKGREEIKED